MQHDFEQFFEYFLKSDWNIFLINQKIRICIEIKILIFLFRLFCIKSLRQTNLCKTSEENKR